MRAYVYMLCTGVCVCVCNFEYVYSHFHVYSCVSLSLFFFSTEINTSEDLSFVFVCLFCDYSTDDKG